MRTIWPTVRPTLTRGVGDTMRAMIASTSFCSSGTGLGRRSRSSSAETKPVTPGVLRTTYQLSSSISIWTRM